MVTKKNSKKEIKDSNAEIIGVYDRFAKSYAEYTWPIILQYELTKFANYLKIGDKILDAGCGAGRDVQYLSEEGFEVTGIDMSKNLIKESLKRFKDGDFRLMDFRNPKFRNGFFNGIWFHGSFCHVKKKNALQTLLNLKKVLKKGGILYVGLREGQGEKKDKYTDTGNLPLFFAYYTEQEMISLLEKAGFNILKSYTEKDGHSARWINIFAQKN